MSADAYEHFGREYRRLYNRAADLALLTHGTEPNVESDVAHCVQRIDRALAGIDVNVAYLALSHVLEHHFMQPMSGR